jgi:drug/metabolite transporter (DMT)-like permease
MTMQARKGLAMAQTAMPLLFAGLWATGFIAARLVAPHAEPLTFLMIRYGLSTLVFSAMAVVAGAPWPRTVASWRSALVAGVLMQGMYLGGVFWAVRHGLPAGISALIAGLQPLLTGALAYPLLRERVGRRRWFGIAVGFCGAVLVLLPGAGSVGALPLLPLGVCFAGVAAMTLGTIWQKRTAVGADLRTNAAVQFIGAAVVTAPFALLLEHGQFDGSLAVWAGLLWAVFGLSVGAISLLMVLLRRGAIAGVASLFYLVTPAAAAMAFLLFGERLSVVQVGGMLVAAAGVAIANRG